MKAEIIAVGSELLGAGRVDTNSLFLAGKLGERGILLARKCVVGDDRELLASEIARARKASEVVILTGGLGPTLDDLTREAASDATGRPLVKHQWIVREIEERFRQFRRPMASVNKRQAYVLDGAEALRNPRGTAPGQWLEDSRGILILLPGPPREMKPLFMEACLPRLESRVPDLSYFTLCLRVAGMGESDVEQRIGKIYSRAPGVVTTILSKPGDIQIHLRAQAGTAPKARLLAESVGSQIREALGHRVYSDDGSSLSVTVARHLREKCLRVAVAESCTGGLLAGKLTDAPGSSEYFAGGIVSYANEAKSRWLGVERDILESHGTVSAQSAESMAIAARNAAAETLGNPAIGVAVTGYAGPDGGTRTCPVGTVFFGIADGDSPRAIRRQLGRGRGRVRALAVQTALELLRRTVLGLPTRSRGERR